MQIFMWKCFVTLPPPSAHQLTPFFNLTSSLHTDEKKETERRTAERQPRWGRQTKHREENEERSSERWAAQFRALAERLRGGGRKWWQRELGHCGEMKFREEAPERRGVPHPTRALHLERLEDESALSGPRSPPRPKDERGLLSP